MYKNYIFDLYGTLIDIHTDEYSKNFFKKYAKWLRRQGYTFAWKDFCSKYTKTERAYREQAKIAGKYSKPEIRIENVFHDVFKLQQSLCHANLSSSKSCLWEETGRCTSPPNFDRLRSCPCGVRPRRPQAPFCRGRRS